MLTWARLLSAKWRMLRNPLVVGILATLSAFFVVAGYWFHWNQSVGVVAAALTCLWFLLTLPWAAFEVWRDERLACIALEEKLAPPPPTGRVLWFDSLDYRDLTKEHYQDAEREFHRRVKANVVTFTYLARIEIQNTGTPTRATHWRVSLRRRDESAAKCEAVAKSLIVPKTWPQRQYMSLDEITAVFLRPFEVYNVSLQIQADASISHLDMASFEARFVTDNGLEVVCKM